MAPSPGRARKRAPAMRRNMVLFLLTVSLTAQCLLWRTSQRLNAWKDSSGNFRLSRQVNGEDTIYRTSWTSQVGSDAEPFQISSIWKRATDSLPSPYREQILAPMSELQESGDDGGTLLGIDYQGIWDNAPPQSRPFVFVALVLWAVFLFSTIGISASDFFCPNLATIADRLGLSESTAGVTFLAFGNGSPDVFSTFSALKTNTFSLAIGELLGAATFITTVVVGAMALVQPFEVPRWPFVRDAGFLCLAVSILAACLKDGNLKLFEAIGMIALYIAYVVLVVTGNWWRKRMRWKTYDPISVEGGVHPATSPSESELQHETSVRTSDYGSRTSSLHMHHLSVSGQDRSGAPSLSVSTNSPLLHASPSGLTSRRSPDPDLPTLGLPSPADAPHPRVTPLLYATQRRPVSDTPRPTFSLLGAVEFRDAINALRRESTASFRLQHGSGTPEGALEQAPPSPRYEGAAFDDYLGPISPFPRGHYHPHHHSPRLQRVPSSSNKVHRHRSDVAIPTISSIRATNVDPDDESPDRLQAPRSHTVAEPVQAQTALSNGRLGPSQQEASEMTPAVPEADKSDPVTDLNETTRPQPEISVPEERAVEVVPPEVATGASSNRCSSEPTGLGRSLRTALHLLFPSLYDFREKSRLGQFLAIFTAPAILALTLTLPVVDDSAEGYSVNKSAIQLYPDDENLGRDPEYDNGSSISGEEEIEGARTHEVGFAGAMLHHLVEADLTDPNTRSPACIQDHLNGYQALPKEGDDNDEVEDDNFSEESERRILLFNRYLTAAQCVLEPLFIAVIMFSDNPFSKFIIPVAAIGGVAAAVLVLKFSTDGSDPFWRMVRCFAGFFSAMAWIATIADEVVEVLKTFGHILGMSHALIGLTRRSLYGFPKSSSSPDLLTFMRRNNLVFAIGNSCADLIANLTVASFAPAMSYSACFGGPMLNILLGVGGAGTGAILRTRAPYSVSFSPTLWVSTGGLVLILLITMVCVPLSGFKITRKWAFFLIGYYVVLTIVNIVVETQGTRISPS